jgi:nitrite reductase (NAD(P)H)
MSNSEWNDAEANRLPEKVASLESQNGIPNGDTTKRKKIVVVGLGMVGIAFMWASL